MKVRASRVRRAAAKNGGVRPKILKDTVRPVRKLLKNQIDDLMLELQMLQTRQNHRVQTLQKSETRTSETAQQIA